MTVKLEELEGKRPIRQTRLTVGKVKTAGKEVRIERTPNGDKNSGSTGGRKLE